MNDRKVALIDIEGVGWDGDRMVMGRDTYE